MNLSQRFAALLGLFAGIFCAALVVLHWLQQQGLDRAAAATAQESRQQLSRALELHGQHLDMFSLDYSQWDELADYIKAPTPEWTDINIIPTLAKFEIDTVWICGPDGQLIYQSANATPLPALGHPSGNTSPDTPHFAHYYTQSQGQTYEIRVCPIQPSHDTQRKTRPLGWLIAARQLNSDYFASIGKTALSKITLCQNPQSCAQTAKAEKIQFTQSLPTLPGQPPLALCSEHNPTLLQIHADTDDEELLLVASHSILFIVALFLSISFWVIRPIALIKNSLTSGKLDLLTSIRTSRTEMGDLARIVRTHYAHQKALQENIDNNARLQRDLHDGVLQTIYASGMGLALTRNLVRENPDEAERRLDQAGLQLNQLIRDIRAYLNHLTPDSNPTLNLPESIHALVEWYKKLHPFDSEITISPALPADLPIQLKSELLLLLREAISNSLRHAHTDRLTIELAPTDAHHLKLTYHDDGIGFDPAKLTRQGHGLNNMKTRAHSLGGICEIISAPGKGTTITLRLPIHFSAVPFTPPPAHS